MTKQPLWSIQEKFERNQESVSLIVSKVLAPLDFVLLMAPCSQLNFNGCKQIKIDCLNVCFLLSPAKCVLYNFIPKNLSQKWLKVKIIF